jgi:BlaI family penicillinase repressor
MLIFTHAPDSTIMTETLSRRERQIMDILFAMGRASGPEIQERLPDRPGYSGVRTILRVLERKGHIRHIEEGMRYVYLPVATREKATKSAIERLVATFFDGSVKAAAAAFLDPSTAGLSKDDLMELERMIRKARKEKT